MRWIGLAIMLPAMIAVALLGMDAALVVKTINESALKRETAALERGFALLGDLHASELLTRALSDEAFRNVVLSRELGWIRENFGSETLAPEGPHELVIVAPHGEPIFSSAHGEAPSPEQGAHLLEAAAPAMARARMLYRKAHAAGGDFGTRVGDGIVDGLYVTDMALIGGHPAMITVSPFAPVSESPDAPADPTLLVGVQHLSDDVLGKLGTLSHIDGLAHVADDHTEQTGIYAHPIKDADGNVVTHLAWTLSDPGHAVLWAAAPAIAVSLTTILLLTLLGAFTMRRLTRQLAENEAAATYAARHDTATGLANRGWFMRVLADALEGRGKGPGTRAVLLIDCDYFKAVNDTLGHGAGDHVLVEVGRILRAAVRERDLVMRVGGDEFILLLPGIDAPEPVERLGARIRAQVARPIPFGDTFCHIAVSIGAILSRDYPHPRADRLLSDVDHALYVAKRAGRGRLMLARPGDPAAQWALPPSSPERAG